MPQPGCNNESTGPWLTRCYAAHRRYEDLAAYGAVYGPSGAYERTGYLVHALGTDLLCSGVMTYECIDSYGGLGCYYSVYPRNKNATAARTPAPPTTPMPSLTPAPAAEQQHPPGSPRVLLIAVLCSVLGCAVLVVTVSFLVISWRRKRRLLETQAEVRFGHPPLHHNVKATAPPHGKSCQGKDVSGGRPAHESGSSDVTTGGCAQQQTITLDVLAPRDYGGGRQQAPMAPLANGEQEEARDDHPMGKVRGRELERQLCPVGLETPVTLNTPPRKDMHLLVGAETLEGKEVKLLQNATRGVGSFGQVVEGIYQGQRVAVKLVAESYQWTGGPSESLLRSFAQEVEVLCRCQHPNVVRLLAACLTPPRICLVMELMETSLEKLMYGGVRRTSGSDHRLPMITVLNVALEISKGLEYLHPTVMHRDLKPANVLINDPTNIRPEVKLTDFGLSRLRSTEAPTQTPGAGTPAYLAPEGLDPMNAVITHKADIYSLAVLLWEMLAGERPWSGCNMMDVAIRVALQGARPPLELIPPDRCPPKLRALIESCWQTDPRRRPAAAEVVKSLALILQEVEFGAAEGVAGVAAAGAAAAPIPPSLRAPAVRGAGLTADLRKPAEVCTAAEVEGCAAAVGAEEAEHATDAGGNSGADAGAAAEGLEQQQATNNGPDCGRGARVLQQEADSAMVAAIAAAADRVEPESLDYTNDQPAGLSDSGLPRSTYGGGCVVVNMDPQQRPQPEWITPGCDPRPVAMVVAVHDFAAGQTVAKQLAGGGTAAAAESVRPMGQPQKLSEFGGMGNGSEDCAKALTVSFLSSFATGPESAQQQEQQQQQQQQQQHDARGPSHSSSPGNLVSWGGGAPTHVTLLASIPEAEPCTSPAAL